MGNKNKLLYIFISLRIFTKIKIKVILMTICIKIPAKIKTNTPVKTIEKDYVEVEFRYLKHLHYTWVKFINETESSGGFLSKVGLDSITLRIPSKREERIVTEKDTVFLVKRDNENYISLQDFMIERERTGYKKCIL